MKPFAVDEPLHDASALRHDAAGLRARAAQDGYLLLRRLLPRPPLAAVRAVVLSRAREIGHLSPRGDWLAGPAPALHEVPSWLALQGAVQQTPEFQVLPRHPLLVSLLESLFGGPVVTDQGSVCRLAPGERLVPATPAHRDADFLGGRTSVWVAWLPLADCGIEQGVLAVAPGSRASGDAGPWAASPLQVGDVLLFSAGTLHRACPNLAPRRVRLSVDLRFMPGDGPGDPLRRGRP